MKIKRTPHTREPKFPVTTHITKADADRFEAIAVANNWNASQTMRQALALLYAKHERENAAA